MLQKIKKHNPIQKYLTHTPLPLIINAKSSDAQTAIKQNKA